MYEVFLLISQLSPQEIRNRNVHLGLLLTFWPVLRNVTMLSYTITIVSYNNIILQSVVSKNVPFLPVTATATRKIKDNHNLF